MSSRNLQITIFEAPGDGRRRGHAGHRGRGSDPETNYVLPPPEDPETNYVLPPPEDPETNYVLPPPEDPETNYVLPPPEDPAGGAGSPWGDRRPPAADGPAVTARYLPAFSGTASAGCCGCSCKGDRCGCDDEPDERPCISPGDYSGFLIVRLARGVGPLDVDSLWELARASGLEGLKSVLEGPDFGEEPEVEPEGFRAEPPGALVSRPLVQLAGCTRSAVVGHLETLARRAARTALAPRCGLERYWRVDLRPHPDLVAEAFDAFEALAEVDLVYRELVARDTTAGADDRSAGNLVGDQGYFEPAPVGVGARRVRELLAGTSGSSLQVVDLEQGWLERHKELAQLDLSPLHGDNREGDEPGAGHHGAAVLGQLGAEGVDELGVVGLVAGLAGFHLSSHYRTGKESPSRNNPFPGTNGHVASGIVSCLVGNPPALGVGDVLLLEVQRGRLPTETDPADLDAIRLAVALGVIVVEAAGNGGFDLDRCDDPRTGHTLRRGAPGFVDSGAILVGAAWSELPHDRAPFSNYGSRLDCYAWGEGVTTCGYGDLHGDDDPHEYYTNTFDGTSSAAPIIAGVAALLQILYTRETGRHVLTPAAMRALLASRATGTPQGPNVGGHIGVMPDLERILGDVLGLVPALYLRRHPCDDGAPPDRDGTISSCPDIVLVDGNGTPALGEVAPSAHHPASGRSSGEPGKLTVRARNRGLVEGSAEVLLFTSPAATLIAPDDWQPLELPSSPLKLTGVPPGDTLHPAGSAPLDWTPPAPGSHSFLAVLFPEGCTPPDPPVCALPPRGPYFDWRQYLEFLRGPTVGWRNIHPVPASSGPDVDLGFLLSSTPDRGRRFDLEVVQRLPAGASVTLHLAPALAAHLRQRQPSITSKGGVLTLPRRRSVRFSHVRLSAGLRAPATFEVRGAPLQPGHSLALRQLWRGVEVGRVTWVVT